MEFPVKLLVSNRRLNIENTQRDINIALVNELAILFKKMNISTKVLNS